MYFRSITFRHPNANGPRNIALYEEVTALVKKGHKVNDAIDIIVKKETYLTKEGNPIKSTNAYRIYNMVCKKVKTAGGDK